MKTCFSLDFKAFFFETCPEFVRSRSTVYGGGRVAGWGLATGKRRFREKATKEKV